MSSVSVCEGFLCATYPLPALFKRFWHKSMHNVYRILSSFTECSANMQHFQLSNKQLVLQTLCLKSTSIYADIGEVHFLFIYYSPAMSDSFEKQIYLPTTTRRQLISTVGLTCEAEARRCCGCDIRRSNHRHISATSYMDLRKQ
jgi:hypothetical protein